MTEAGPLLLVESSRGSRTSLQHADPAGLPRHRRPQHRDSAGRQGRSVSPMPSSAWAAHSTASPSCRLRERSQAMRIVVVTDADSFASVIGALGAGADDYIAQPVAKDELVDALLDRRPTAPGPETPLGLSRTCWEHVMRVYEQCGRNVTIRRTAWACTAARSSACWASGRRPARAARDGNPTGC